MKHDTSKRNHCNVNALLHVNFHWVKTNLKS